MSQKRLLTPQEIEQVLSFITPNPSLPRIVGEDIANRQKDQLRKQLVGQILYPAQIPKLKDELERMYYRSLIQPGTSVGVVSAQSIGERSTQTALDVFHKAGAFSKGASGVDRMTELLNTTDKPKGVNTFVYFNEDASDLYRIRRLCLENLKEIRLSHLVRSIHSTVDKVPEKWYPAFICMYQARYPNINFLEYKSCLSIRIDVDNIYKNRVNLLKIADAIHDNISDVYCIPAPDHLGRIDVFADTSCVEVNEEEDEVAHITMSNAVIVYLEEIVYPKIKNILISGAAGVTEVYYIKEPVDHRQLSDEKGDGSAEGEEKDRWMAETDGCNFIKILAQPFVDSTKTYCNNMWDVCSVLGIEAARQFLIEEFHELTGKINMCHIQLLVDKMTHDGSIRSISRFTLKSERCPLVRASFEQITDQFTSAGLYGHLETTRGVSSSIICAKRPRIGTGMCDVMVDLDMIQKYTR